MTVGNTSRSRAASARPQSAAREILRKREKAYKTEQSKVVVKKRKTNYHTTFGRNAPPGFRFLPVGTSELAERCKELSRQRDMAINVVNAQPVSANAVDPAKVSHYIHRVGYHFRNEVIDQACKELGYTFFQGAFVKEADIQQKQEQSRIANALAKHGIVLDDMSSRETDDQVRAAIKELFPKIPEEDLKEILRHAWEEGSDRVGTNAALDLPRRVQLAVIARIRHVYTDYDRLLRAFEWKDARIMVEPTCLAKLIEWRGENEQDDDNELEEIIRETIVIDDDDDDDIPYRRNDPDEEDSDTSIEISHRPAGDADFGEESADEHSRRFRERYQPPAPRFNQRNVALNQQIGQIREQLRQGVPVSHQPQVIRVHVPEDNNGMINIGGKLYRQKAIGSVESPRSPMYTTPIQQMPSDPYRQPQMSPRGQQLYASQSMPPHAPPANAIPLQDRVVASIEPHEELRRAALMPASAGDDRVYPNMPRAASPEGGRPAKRRQTDYPTPVATADMYRQPHSPAGSVRVHPMGHPHMQRIEPMGGPSAYGLPYEHRRIQEEEPYDPRWPLLPANHGQATFGENGHRADEARPAFVNAQVAPIQYMERPLQSTRAYTAQPQGYGMQQQPRVVYLAAGTPQPQPVHGAPAVVQQVPRLNEQHAAHVPAFQGQQPYPLNQHPPPRYQQWPPHRTAG